MCQGKTYFVNVEPDVRFFSCHNDHDDADVIKVKYLRGKKEQDIKMSITRPLLISPTCESYRSYR